jgi:hypothetical protein
LNGKKEAVPGILGELTKSRTLLVAIGLAAAAILLLSSRPIGLTDAMRFDEIMTLPDTDRLEPVRRYAMIGSGIIPYMPGEAAPPYRARPPIKVGWTYREISALRMPFYARPQFGPVTFVDLPEGRQFAELGPEQVALLEELAGQPVASGYGFPWYAHLWGWLVVLVLIGWTLLRRREARIREDAHWASVEVASDGDRER